MDQTFIGPSESKKWTVTICFAVVYGLLVTLYIQNVYDSNYNLAFLSSLLAATGGFMLATAFSASSLSYFTGWPNMKLGYQKQIGVLAFWLCLFYCFSLPILQPDIYYYGFFENLTTPNFIFGLGAMIIFGLMVAINSKPIAKHFEWPTISFFLNLGFVGYAFLVIRAIFLEWPLWANWLTSFEGFPTNRFILSVLAMVVLLLRLAVIIHKHRHKKSV
jgi:hypothetical protein